MNDILDENFERSSKSSIPNLMASTILLCPAGLGFLFQIMHLKYAFVLLIAGLVLGLSYQLGCFIVLRGKNTANNWLLGINVIMVVVVLTMGKMFTSVFMPFIAFILPIAALTLILIPLLNRRRKDG